MEPRYKRKPLVGATEIFLCEVGRFDVWFLKLANHHKLANRHPVLACQYDSGPMPVYYLHQRNMPSITGTVEGLEQCMHRGLTDGERDRLQALYVIYGLDTPGDEL